MFLWNHYLVKYYFNIIMMAVGISRSLVTKRTTWLLRSSPLIKFLSKDTFLNLAFQSRITLIFPGLLRWETTLCGMYHALPSGVFDRLLRITLLEEIFCKNYIKSMKIVRFLMNLLFNYWILFFVKCLLFGDFL